MQLRVAKRPDLRLSLWSSSIHSFQHHGVLYRFHRWLRHPTEETQPQLEALLKLSSSPAASGGRDGLNPLLSQTPLVLFDPSPSLPLVDFSRGLLGLCAVGWRDGEQPPTAQVIAGVREAFIEDDWQLLYASISYFLARLQDNWLAHRGVNYLVPISAHHTGTPWEESMPAFINSFWGCKAFPLLDCTTAFKANNALPLMGTGEQLHYPEDLPHRWSPVILLDERSPVDISHYFVPNFLGKEGAYADFLNGYIRDAGRRVVGECGIAHTVLLQTDSRHEYSGDFPAWVDKLAHRCREAEVPFLLVPAKERVYQDS